MSLQNQIQIYSVDTSFFYNKTERRTHDILNKGYILRLKYRKELNKAEKRKDDLEISKLNDKLRIVNKHIKQCKDILYIKLSKNNSIRTFNDNYINNKNTISVFESVLTRTIGAETDKFCTDILVVQTYFFQVLEDIICNGFYWNGEKYKCFTASAGQIRTKKTLFIKESVWEKHKLSLMCGLTIESINKQGGMNINKFLAYLALCNSATDQWYDFNIDNAIVVEDMETTVRSLVDFIDDKTYEIERKEMDIEISHTDGCGMILPSISKKSFMCRLPFVKGLLVSFPFDKYIRELNRNNKDIKFGKVKDIYNKEYDILEDKISIIFTKSQFKMWKYFSSWDEYKENFKKYNCQAGITNKEEDEFGIAKLNYQMLQTLTDIKDSELEILASKTVKQIKKIGKDRKTMLKVLGVVDSNTNKNYLQQALEIYPELLNDTYSKEILKQLKKKLVKEGRAAKFEIDSKYTFICPDLYAFCEFLVKGDKNPKGLLNNGEVSCKLYSQKEKLDCLRSPHLYREHAIRKNVITKEMKRWFVTDGIYTSIHDPISKILMFDVDGDRSLVCADETLIEVAERNMQDIVPLYYNMAKANAELITNENIYKGLTLAYSGGNIGQISNEITKIWNNHNVSLKAIKILCMESNFTIDYAKTLYKPTRPKEINKLIHTYTRLKTPRFFIYAKDKNEDQVEKPNNSVVNRLEKIIPNPIINFRGAKLGKFNYKMLMKNPNVKLDTSIIEKYTELDLNKRFIALGNIDDLTSSDELYIYKDIRSKILEVNDDIQYVTDVLIEYLYNQKKSSFKATLWSSFGDIIVENLKINIENELHNTLLCEVCSERIENTVGNKKYCDNCAKEIKAMQTRKSARESMRRLRETRNVKKAEKTL
jgi:hypothetical protein